MNSKIRIRNLPEEADSSSIQDFLTSVGDVFTIRMEMEHGMRTAYVQMANETQAKDCVARFNNQRYRGQMLSVCEDGLAQKMKSRIAASR